MANFGVSSDGFNAKRITDLENEIFEKLKELVDPRIAKETSSAWAQLVEPFSEKLEELWAELNKLSGQRSSKDAEGVNLDYILEYIGLKRQPATQGTVEVAIAGTQGTVVGNNFQVSQDAAPLEIFQHITQITLSKENISEFIVRVDNFVGGQTYIIEADGVNYNYSSAGTGTVEDVVDGLVNNINSYGSVPHVLIAEKLTPNSLRLTPRNQNSWATTSVTADMTHFNVSQFRAVNFGKFDIAIDSVNTVVTALLGVDEVNNFIEGIPGENVETDPEARIRRENSFSASGKATEDAITANILALEGVTFAITNSNREIVAVNGLPPKSVQLIVENGDDQEIGQKLWETVGGGIETFGTIPIVATDITGRPQTVKFTRPTPQYAWIRATVTQDTDPLNLPGTNFEQQVEDALLSYGENNFSIGTDMIVQKFECPVQSVQGTLEVVIELAVTPNPGDTPTYGTSNIVIGDTEKAVFDPSRITVIVV